MSRGTIVHGRLTMPVACFVMTAMLPFSAVTVDAVSGAVPLGGDVALYQDATQDGATGQVAEPATGDAPAPAGEWVEPVVTDSTSKETLVDSTSAVDPAPVEWTDSAPIDPASSAPVTNPAAGEAIDPTTGKGGEPAPVDAVPIEPAPATEPAPLSTSGTAGAEPWGEPIATAYIAGTGGDGAPCLASPQWGAETLAVLGEGEPIEVRAETMGEWQPVNCAGAGGYLHVALIAWTPVGSAVPATTGDRPGRATGGRESVGEQIVNFALQFEGYPYIYAGEGPYAFDCSGFTMFVINNTLGLGVPHDMAVQYQMGRSVGRDELRPGDLVFFQNTIRPGMSHDGIYIGGGQFIHAETESSGVTISDLASEYYSSRWYGAVRFS